MSTISVSSHVSAPVDQAFATFTDLDKWEARIAPIESLEILSDGPFAEGTRWRETRVIMKKESTEEMWVSAFDPTNSYTVSAASHGMTYESVFSFVPENDGTRVTWAFTGTPKSFGAKIMSPIFGVLMNRMMKKMMLQDLEAHGQACERPSE